MLHANVRNGSWLFARTAILVAAFLVGNSAQATTYDCGSIFAEDFTGSTLDTTKWASDANFPGTVTMDGISSAVLDSGTGGTNNVVGRANVSTKSALDFGSSPNEWQLEVKFQMRDHTKWTSVSTTKQFSILSGLTNVANDFTVQGFDLRAVRYNGTNWYLGWYGGDNTGDRTAADLLSGGSVSFSSTVSHTVALTRKSDGNVDIYLDNSFLGSRALIGGSNPVGLLAGDWSTTAIAGKMALDSITISGAAPVPEPSSIAMTVAGLIGLLAYAWRKRK